MPIVRSIIPQIITLIIASFGLVAALAWNTAIQNTFSRYFPVDNGTKLLPQYLYAIFVSFFIIIISVYLSGISKKFKSA